MLDCEHLGGRIGKSSTNRRGHAVELCLGQLFGQAEVGNTDMAFIDEDVLRFQVAVDDVFGVEVLECEDELGHEELCFPFMEAAVALEVLEEITTRIEIGDKVKGCLCLEGKSDLNV